MACIYVKDLVGDIPDEIDHQVSPGNFGGLFVCGLHLVPSWYNYYYLFSVVFTFLSSLFNTMIMTFY